VTTDSATRLVATFAAPVPACVAARTVEPAPVIVTAPVQRLTVATEVSELEYVSGASVLDGANARIGRK